MSHVASASRAAALSGATLGGLRPSAISQSLRERSVLSAAGGIRCRGHLESSSSRTVSTTVACAAVPTATTSQVFQPLQASRSLCSRTHSIKTVCHSSRKSVIQSRHRCACRSALHEHTSLNRRQLLGTGILLSTAPFSSALARPVAMAATVSEAEKNWKFKRVPDRMAEDDDFDEAKPPMSLGPWINWFVPWLNVSPAEKVLEDPKWPAVWPFRADDLLRYDESPDAEFYSSPRLVYHIDEFAVKALTNYYAEVFPKSGQQDTALLDICSSWVSHYPAGYTAGRVAGLGMNEAELARNPQLTEYVVKDLNDDPQLPFENNTFDVVTNCVSVDYLTKPLQVFQEIHRVLKPGGVAIMSFSNRCFPTKAIALWTATGDLDHVWIVGSYFHYSVPQGFSEPKCKDISPAPGLFGRTDPMYVVYATKVA